MSERKKPRTYGGLVERLQERRKDAYSHGDPAVSIDFDLADALYDALVREADADGMRVRELEKALRPVLKIATRYVYSLEDREICANAKAVLAGVLAVPEPLSVRVGTGLSPRPSKDP